MEGLNVGETLVSLFTLAFTSWAGVVLWVGMGLRKDGKDIRDELKAVSQQLNDYVIQTEKRLTYLETQISAIIDGWRRRYTHEHRRSKDDES